MVDGEDRGDLGLKRLSRGAGGAAGTSDFGDGARDEGR